MVYDSATGGGGYKPRKFTIFRTKNDMILLPFIPVKKCDTRGVSWGKPEDTLAKKG